MLLIPCPYCGERAEIEFSYGGEAHIVRPKQPETLTDEEWAAFVFWRKNTKGTFQERWMHAQGCRRWFNLGSDTVSYEILGAYEAGQPAPALEVKRYV